MATTIRIGQASISENNTAYGEAGDQTGKEVYIVDNYNISRVTPYIVLRPKKASIASGSVIACIAGCNNDNIGYSQSGRNTLYSSAKAVNFDLSQVGLCNTDCSAFITVCAIAAGARITYGSNAPTTANMRTRFKQSGDYEVLTDLKYTTMTDYLKAGDILVHENTHAIMVLENGRESGGETADIEQVESLQTYNVYTNVTELKSNSAIINIKTIKQLNAVESVITVKNWDYVLEYRALPTGSLTELVISNNKAALSGLTKNTCYMYRVKVKNADAVLFCSAYKTFNTKNNDTDSDIKITTLDGKYIDIAYIKTEDGYRPVIPYIN